MSRRLWKRILQPDHGSKGPGQRRARSRPGTYRVDRTAAAWGPPSLASPGPARGCNGKRKGNTGNAPRSQESRSGEFSSEDRQGTGGS